MHKKETFNSKSIIQQGIYIIVVTIFIFGFWASFAPLSSSSVAIGVVSVDINKQEIQHPKAKFQE